jgi:hypothetical protein
MAVSSSPEVPVLLGRRTEEQDPVPKFCRYLGSFFSTLFRFTLTE